MAKPEQQKTHDTTVQVSSNELDDLRRLKVVQEAKAELLTWGKQWTAIITVVAAVVGLIGFNVIVATVIQGLIRDEIREAQTAAIKATDSSSRAQTQMEKAIKAATKYTEQVKKLKDDADKISGRLAELHAALDGKGRSVRQEVRSLTRDLENRLNVLEVSLANVIAEASTENAAAEFHRETERLEKESAKTREIFKTNSRYTAEIAFYDETHSKAEAIATALEEQGFQTAISPSAVNAEEATGVPKGTLFEATKVVLLYDRGQEVKGTVVGGIVESTIKESIQSIAVPPTESSNWMVVFLPKERHPLGH